MASVRLSDLVAPYEGVGASGDFPEWCERLELIAKLQKIDDVASFMPLFLRGEAFAVYQQLSAATKASFKELKGAMVAAFGMGSLAAYQRLRVRELQEGESVDSYVADIRRLIKLVGMDSVPASLVRAVFLAGLPERCREQITMLPEVDSLSMDVLLQKARTLLAAGRVEGRVVGAAGALRGAGREKGRGGMAVGTASEGRRCFACQGTDHLARACPRRVVRCYKCGESGHIMKDCTKQGNAGGEVRSLPAASPRQ